MNQTIRRGDYLQVDYIEPPPVVDEKKKKASQQPNANIYSQLISPSQCLNKFRIPLKVSPTDGYAISNIRDKLIQLKKETEGRQGSGEVQREIERLFLELRNLETLQKVEVNVKPFIKSEKPDTKLPPPKDYTLVLPFSTQLQSRVCRLQSIQYPNLILVQLLTSILLNQKPPTLTLETNSSRNVDKKAQLSAITKNEDLIALSNRFEKIEGTISGFSSLVERIDKDQLVHGNAIGFIEKLRRVSDEHHEVLEELGEGEGLGDKLKGNWEENKKVFGETIKQLKERLNRLKK